MKRVIVTGASGFIGRYIVERLLEEKYEVIALQHSNENLYSKEIKKYSVDISNGEQIRYLTEKMGVCDVVVHLAADLNIMGDHKTIKTNCQGTYNVIHMAKKLQASSIIYLSSVPVIGEPKTHPIEEGHVVEPNTLYHATKLFGEHIVKMECSDRMRTVIYRISSPIGKGMNGATFLPTVLRLLSENKSVHVFGKGTRCQNYIDVRDIADVFVQGIKRKAQGLYLVPGATTISNLDLVRLCVEILDSKSEILLENIDRPDDKICWDVSGEKVRNEMGFVPKHDITETIKWMCDIKEGNE